jgi:hypothetical protein
MITTTLNRIRKHSPCQDGWEQLLTGLGKTKADDEPLPFATIVKINGLKDALWCFRVEPQYAKEWQLYAVSCARRVQHLNTDPLVKQAIDVAERYANGDASDDELTIARAAAWDAVGAAADAVNAARAAANAAAGAAADALNAAWAAANAAAGAAADAAWAARSAADPAARDAEREWQGKEFLRVVTETEAREDGE